MRIFLRTATFWRQIAALPSRSRLFFAFEPAPLIGMGSERSILALLQILDRRVKHLHG